MLTKIDICNISLGLIGTNPINSFEEPSKESIICKQYYDNCKNKLLARFNWSFARKIASLNIISSDEYITLKDRYKNIFQLPSDLINIIQIFESESISFIVMGDKLLTSADTITILYLSAEDNTSLYSPLFIDTLTYTLAADIAMNITDTYQLSANLKILAEEKLKLAISIDANSFTDSSNSNKNIYFN